MKLLVPVDGSPSSLRAVEHVCGMARDGVDIHLINVQLPLPSAASSFVGEAERRSFHQEEAGKELRDAEAILDRAGVRYQRHIVVGPVAETIAEYARQHGCDQIVMGSRGLGAIPNLLLGSVATKLLHVSEVPVTIVR